MLALPCPGRSMLTTTSPVLTCPPQHPTRYWPRFSLSLSHPTPCFLRLLWLCCTLWKVTVKAVTRSSPHEHSQRFYWQPLQTSDLTATSKEAVLGYLVPPSCGTGDDPGLRGAGIQRSAGRVAPLTERAPGGGGPRPVLGTVPSPSLAPRLRHPYSLAHSLAHSLAVALEGA